MGWGGWKHTTGGSSVTASLSEHGHRSVCQVRRSHQALRRKRGPVVRQLPCIHPEGEERMTRPAFSAATPKARLVQWCQQAGMSVRNDATCIIRQVRVTYCA